MEVRFQARSIKQAIDWKLIICYLVLVIIGWVNIYASSHNAPKDDGLNSVVVAEQFQVEDDPFEFSDIIDFSTRSGKQTIWILTALVLAVLILFVLSPHVWEGLSLWIYGGVLLLLVAVIFLGVEVKGSRSWFEFGPVRFQPAEISKISTSLLIAMLMSRTNFKMSNIKEFLLVAGGIGLPMLVILGEKETGSALVYVGFLFVLYRQGLSGWWIVALGMAIGLFVFTLTMSPYFSVVFLMGMLILFNVLNSDNVWKGLAISVPVIVFLSLFPWLWDKIQCLLIPGFHAITETTDITVMNSIEANTHWMFLAGVKPFSVLLGLGLCAIPVFVVKAFRQRDKFLGLSVVGFVAGILLVFSTDIIFNNVLQEHQRKRIEVLLGLKEDPSGVGYNVNQSMIAIGSGGFTGKGFMEGTQTTYGFVPEQSTDFIFCTVGEEWGFTGCLAVVLLYCFLIIRILHDAERSRETFTRVYGYCVAACIFMHLFINIGMTIGLMPVIGIPLPLLSYGGSSLWAFTILIFIFIALYREEKKYF